MKYTRYDLKENKKGGLFLTVVLILMLVCAILIGTIVSKLLEGKYSGVNGNINENSKEQNIVLKNAGGEKYVVLQGGEFAVADNANKLKDSLSQTMYPFIKKDGDKTRVLIGVYTEEKANQIEKDLKSKNIDASSMTFKIEPADNCTVQIKDCIDAYIKVLNALEDSDVKSYNTSSFKNWMLKLKPTDGKSKNEKILKQIKTYIKSLPDTADKSIISENYSLLYEVIAGVSKKIP